MNRETAGQRVTPRTAERIAAAYACKTAIAESFAMLPAHVYEEKGNKKRKVKEHPLWSLLRDGPNPYADSFMFFESSVYSALDCGDSFAHVTKKVSGAITDLMPLPYENISYKMVTNKNGLRRLQYKFVDPLTKEPKEYDQDEIFHFRYHSKDGITGQSPIRVAAEVFARGLAHQQHGNRLFQNGAFMSGLLKTAFEFENDDARERFVDSFKKFMGGANAGKVGLLEQGADYTPLQQTNRDAQFLEDEKLNISDIARIYRVPGIIIQVAEAGMSYASIEQLALMWVQYTILPWVKRWEAAIKKQLLMDNGEEDIYVRFNVNSLIRGDLKSRTEAIVQQLQYGLKTINEGRNLLDENPIDSEVGDEVFLSHNLMPASKVMAGLGTPATDDGDEEDDLEEESTGIRVKDPPADEEEEEPKSSKKSARNGKVSAGDRQEDDHEKVGFRAEKENFRPLFHSLLSRIARKEERSVESAAKKPGFLKWADGFYSEHRDLLRETLEPAFVAAGSAEAIEQFVSAYLESRHAQILNSAGGSCKFNDAETWAARAVDLIIEGGTVQ